MKPEYKIEMKMTSNHLVGYSVKDDKIFEYWIESGLIFVWQPDITDALLCYDVNKVDPNLFEVLGSL